MRSVIRIHVSGVWSKLSKCFSEYAMGRREFVIYDPLKIKAWTHSLECIHPLGLQRAREEQ